MDWTNTAHEAAGVDLAKVTQDFLRENPRGAQATAAGLGLADGVLMGFPSRAIPPLFSPMRNENPLTYRAAQYSLPALATYLFPSGGAPFLAAALLNEPYLHRLYHDYVEPKAFDAPNALASTHNASLANALMRDSASREK